MTSTQMTTHSTDQQWQRSNSNCFRLVVEVVKFRCCPRLVVVLSFFCLWFSSFASCSQFLSLLYRYFESLWSSAAHGFAWSSVHRCDLGRWWLHCLTHAGHLRVRAQGGGPRHADAFDVHQHGGRKVQGERRKQVEDDDELIFFSFFRRLSLFAALRAFATSLLFVETRRWERSGRPFATALRMEAIWCATFARHTETTFALELPDTLKDIPMRSPTRRSCTG